MNLDALALVQDSLARVMPAGDRFVTLFYARLFALDPALRALFAGDLRAHGRSVLATLHAGIDGLAAPETIIPTMKRLGRFHASRGIQPDDYHTFGEALLWAVAQVQGAAFTPDVAAAWQDAFFLLAGLMKEAARSPSCPDE